MRSLSCLVLSILIQCLYSQVVEICSLTQPDLSAVNEPQDGAITFDDRRQYIFPNTRFEGCNGNITRVNFVASEFDTTESVSPEIQLWENIGGTTYRLVSGSIIAINVPLLNGSPERKYYSYDVSPGVSFQSGYVLGVFTPRSQDSRLNMNFQTLSAYMSYRVRADSGPQDLAELDLVADLTTNNNAPLINMEISTDGDTTDCTVGFLAEDQLLIASTVSLDSSQLRILPEVIFPCAGEIKNWTIAATLNTGGGRNEYPGLQIWRPNSDPPTSYNRMDEVTLPPPLTTDVNLHSGVLDSPLQFSAGDVPGLYLPRFGGGGASGVVGLFFINGYELLNYVVSPVTIPLPAAITVPPPSMDIDVALPLISLGIDFFPTTNIVTSVPQTTSIPLILSTEVSTSTFVANPSTSLKVSTTITLDRSTPVLLSSMSPSASIEISSTLDASMTGSVTSSLENVFVTPSEMLTITIPPSLSPTSSSENDITSSISVQLTTSSNGASITALNSETSTVFSTTSPLATLNPLSSSLPLSTAPSTIETITISSALLSSSQSMETTSPLTTSNILLPSATSPVFRTMQLTSSMDVSVSESTSSYMSTSSLILTSTPTPSPIASIVSSSIDDSNTAIPSLEIVTLLPTSSMLLTNIMGTVLSTVESGVKSTPNPPPSALIVSSEISVEITSSELLMLLPTSSILLTNPSVPMGTVTSTIGLGIGIAVGAIVVLIVIVVLTVVLLKRQRRRYKFPNVHSNGVPNPVYSSIEMTLTNRGCNSTDHNEPPVYSDLEERYQDLDNSELERNFPNPLYSEHKLDLEDSYFDNSIYSVPTRSQTTLSTRGIYVPTQNQRKEPVTSKADLSSVYDTLYSVLQEEGKDDALKFFEEQPIYWTPSSNANMLYEQLARHKYREIPLNELNISECIGSGQFGVVKKGVWTSLDGPKDVAVKTLNDETTEEDKVKLLQEAAINGQFHHRSIISLHGVVTIGNEAMIILELMEGGNMKDYLPTLLQRVEQDDKEVAMKCLDYSCQIASGMSYLSNKQFVHRDLAARNILMTKNGGQCKISDFGMARDLEESDYYISQGGLVPLKWTSPEALHYKKYSSASDVWSYGVLLFEIWSLGCKPFEGVTNMEVIRKLSNGSRLSPPPGCTRAIYKLMIGCWHPDFKLRPTFGQILTHYSQPLSELLKWDQKDVAVDAQATVLGAPLTAGFDLYTDLQNVYEN